MKGRIAVVLYGVFGVIVAAGLSLGAFAIAGRPIGSPAGPVQLVTLNPTEPSKTGGDPTPATKPEPSTSSRGDHSPIPTSIPSSRPSSSPSPIPPRDEQGGVGDD